MPADATNPAALHPDVGLGDPPGAGGRMQVRAEALVELGCVGLDPAEQGADADRAAAVGGAQAGELLAR